MLDRAAMLSDIVSWRDADPVPRREAMKAVAALIDLPPIASWREVSDEQLRRLYRALFNDDLRTDAQFDDSIPF